MYECTCYNDDPYLLFVLLVRTYSHDKFYFVGKQDAVQQTGYLIYLSWWQIRGYSAGTVVILVTYLPTGDIAEIVIAF